MTLTPDGATALLKRIERFRQGDLSVEGLQSAVSLASAGTQSIEQNELRGLLDWAEGNLDSIRFTRQSSEQREAATAIIDQIEPMLRTAARG